MASVHIEKKDFWEYIRGKQLTMEQLLKLDASDREKIFMKWKHGLSDQNANIEIDRSKQWMLTDLPISSFPVEWQEYVQGHRLFEIKCNEIKEQLGLIARSAPKPIKSEDEEIGDIVQGIGGILVNHGHKIL